MSVVIETTLGDITVDLFLKERPRASLNFLKLCKMKFYNYNLFHTISRGFIAQTGDPTGSRVEGESIYGVLEGPLKRYFQSEKVPRIKHTHLGLLSFVGNEEGMIGSQFFITLGEDLTYLDEKHCVFGEVMEGLDVLELLNETICDNDNRPYQDVRITHTVVLDDPFPDIKNMRPPSRSPSPTAERLQGGRIAADEDIDDTEGKSAAEISEMLAEREAKARATILEMVGDLPDAEMAPPENVLFVCKLNPVTTDDDLEIIFSRFGKIKSCEVIRDRKSGDSLQYAFVEFEEQKSCEDAYFKMDNVLIDDRRIHVDFSQSVSKIKWHGKGRGVTTYDDEGRKSKDFRNDLGKGNYKSQKKFNNGKYKDDNGRNRNVDGRRDGRFQGRNNDFGKFQRRDDREYLRNGRENDKWRVSSPKGRRNSSSEDDRRKNNKREEGRNQDISRNKQRSPEVYRENRRHNEDYSSRNRPRLYNDNVNRSKQGDRRRNEEFNSRNEQRSNDSRRHRKESFSDDENINDRMSKKKRNYLSDEEEEQRRRKNRRENRQREDSSEDDRKQNRKYIKEDSRRGYQDSRYKSGDKSKSHPSKSSIDYKRKKYEDFDRKKYDDYDRKKSYDDYARKKATEKYDRQKFYEDSDTKKTVDDSRKNKYSERDIKKTVPSSSNSDSSSEDEKKKKKKKISCSSSSSSSSEDSSEEDRKRRKKKKKKKSRRKSDSSD